MIIPDKIIKLIERKLGADINLLGIKSVESAILKEINKHKSANINEYVKLILIDENVFNSFVEEIIVPKTWFFRNKESYIFLKDIVVRKWKKSQKPLLKILSIPCSTGEEPYSIAATLFESGLNDSQFHIDAMDVSNKAITFARTGIYSYEHSHIEDVPYNRRYISKNKKSLVVDKVLKDQINFTRSNLLSISDVCNKDYDIIFCRNIFIYLNNKARHKVITGLKKILNDEGIIFTGHAEINIFINSGFVKTGSKNSFVCRVGERKQKIKRVPERKKIKLKKKNNIDDNIIPDRTEKNIIIEGPLPDYHVIKSLADIGKYQQAMDLCESYIQEMEPNADIFYLKGLIHQLQNNIEIAQMNFEKAIYLRPDFYDALLHMSFLMEKKGRVKSAELFKKRAIRSHELSGNRINEK